MIVESQDPGLRGAMLKGIFGIETKPEFCCAGACMWPDTYHSIGFAAECSNVTQLTAQKKKCYSGLRESGHSEMHICNMTTPGGVSLSTVLATGSRLTTLNVNTTIHPISDYYNYNSSVSSEIAKIGVFTATT